MAEAQAGTRTNREKFLKTPKGDVVKTAKEEDSELTSSQRHTKITTIYRETINENNRKIAEEIYS